MKILLSLIVLILSGCASYTPEPYVNSDGKGEVFSSDTAAIATTHIRSVNGRRVVCMAPPPDAAFSEAGTLSLDISLVKSETNTNTDSESASSSVNESELAGRTPSVLLAREAFYRTCEISDNFELTKEEAINLFNKTLDMVSKNWAGETANTTITIGDTVTNTGQQASSSPASNDSDDSDATGDVAQNDE